MIFYRPFVHSFSCMNEMWQWIVEICTLFVLFLPLFLKFSIYYFTVCVVSDEDEPLMAEAGDFACWFFCDFPGLLVISGFAPDCRTLTPRINCEIH